MRVLAWRGLQRRRKHVLDRSRAACRDAAHRSAVQPQADGPRPPAVHRSVRNTEFSSNPLVRPALAELYRRLDPIELRFRAVPVDAPTALRLKIAE